MIYEFHKIDPKNVGDYYCNPSRYFDIPNVSTEHLTKSSADVNNEIIIVGGGGLIHNTFDTHIERLLDQKPRLSAAWGIGHNYGSAVKRKGKPFLFPPYLIKFDLFGVRDWVAGFEAAYVPCVSCMHSAFDAEYAIKHPVVFYLHDAKTPQEVYPDSEPFKTNSNPDIESVIRFLASGETIVTNSYHGAYWGLLLGRKVISTAWSIKFHYFRYPPTLINELGDWKQYHGSTADVDYLAESRELNRDFYREFLNVV